MQLPELGLHEGVEPCGGLIQDQKLDIRRQGGDERHLLPVPLGVGAPLLGGIEVETLQELLFLGLVEPSTKPTEEIDHLAPGEIRPERHIAGDICQPTMQLRGLIPRVPSEESGGAGVTTDQPQQDSDRRRLSRSIGAEEAMYLTGGHLEVEPIEGPNMPEILHQTGDRDRIAHDTRIVGRDLSVSTRGGLARTEDRAHDVMGGKADAGVVECVRFRPGRIPARPESFVQWEVWPWLAPWLAHETGR